MGLLSNSAAAHPYTETKVPPPGFYSKINIIFV